MRLYFEIQSTFNIHDMRIPFIIYAQAYGIYLLLTIPALTDAIIYMFSAMYAFFAGLAALIIFDLLFLLLHFLKPGYKTVVAILLAGVILAVSIAFKLLLVAAMPGRDFLKMDGDVLFPIAAMMAGCIAVFINILRIRKHFSPSVLEEEVNTIGLQP